MEPHRPVNGVARRLRSLNGDGNYARRRLAGGSALRPVSAAGESVRTWLRYDRVALASGELWRPLTAHLVPLDLHHALLNCLGLMLMWALFARDYAPRQWLLIVLGSMAAIDAGLW